MSGLPSICFCLLPKDQLWIGEGIARMPNSSLQATVPIARPIRGLTWFYRAFFGEGHSANPGAG